MLAADARGCPRCARNIEAERMAKRFVCVILAFALIALTAFILIFLRYR